MKSHLLQGMIAGLLVAILSVSAVHAQDLGISGNGAGSSNSINVTHDSTTTVVQQNEANVVNDVNANADTGGNSNSGNTGGGGSIRTGDASTSVHVSNNLNSNQATVGCCHNNPSHSPHPTAAPTSAPSSTPAPTDDDDDDDDDASPTPTPTVVPQVMGASDEADDEEEADISQVMGLSAASGSGLAEHLFYGVGALLTLAGGTITTIARRQKLW